MKIFVLMVSLVLYSIAAISNDRKMELSQTCLSGPCEISIMDEELDILIPNNDVILYINIYKADGTLFYSQNGNGTHHCTIQVSNWPSGSYRVVVVTTNTACVEDVKI